MNIRPVLIGNFGPPTLACIRSWGEKGCPVGFICIAPEKSALPRSKYLDNVIILPADKRFTEEGLDLIKDFLKMFKATGIVAVSEEISCWLYDNKERFPDELSLWVNSSANLKSLLSKDRQVEIAQRSGFDVLPTYYLSKEQENLDSIPGDQYPLCLRPSDPRRVDPPFKVKYIADRDALQHFLNSLQKTEAPIVAQPFLALPNLNTHASRSATGEFWGYGSFLVKRKFKGVSMTFEPHAMPESFYEKCSLIAEGLNVLGPFDIECLYDESAGKTYFIELNNRFGGATAKAFACGYDEPYYALRSFGINCGKPRKLRKVSVVSRQAAVKYCLAMLKKELTPFDYPNEMNYQRILFVLKSFMANYDDVFSFQDLKGSISLYGINIKNKILGI